MKFGNIVQNQGVPEWKAVYIDYKYLKKLLKPFKIMSKVYLNVVYTENKNSSKIYTITNMAKSEMDQLMEFSRRFEQKIFSESSKFALFFNAKIKQNVALWRTFKLNMTILKNLKVDDDYLLHKSLMKNAFHLFYKELILLKEFVNVNQEGIRKILKKHKKVSKNFDSLYKTLKKQTETRFSYLQRNHQTLNFLKSEVENTYLDVFFKKFNRKEGQNELRKISQNRLISQTESFFFGLFFGFALVLTFLIILMAWYGDLDVDDDSLFKDVFPMFRGVGACILYVWLLAWNVFGWTKANVNYKLIFGFNYHFSQISEILKRAAMFTFIFLIMFIWYIILRQNLGKLAIVLSFIPKEITPLLVWAIFLGYLFFPSSKYMNPLGRLYFYRLLKNIFLNPFDKVTFRIAWSTDQIVSFVGPLKDLEYTICFYFGNIFDQNHIDYCQSRDRISSGFIVAFIPLFYRIMQCSRNIYDKKILFGPDFFNCLKYLKSLIVVIFSFLTTIHKNEGIYLNLWIFFAIISTLYSYFWDLKMDWGFLTFKGKHPLLRKELSFENKSFYYLAMSANLILRFAWTLSISPDIVARVIRPEIFTFIICFLEMLRRCIWNFFRVEKEHIQNCGAFKAVENIVLPFDNILMEADDKLFFDEFSNNMNETTWSLPKIKKENFESSDNLSKNLLNTSNIDIESRKSVIEATLEEVKKRMEGSSDETYEDIKKDVDKFVQEMRKKVEFNFKLIEEKEKKK